MKPWLFTAGSLLALAFFAAAKPAAAIATLSTDAEAFDSLTGNGNFQSGTFTAQASFNATVGSSPESAFASADAGFGVLAAIGTATASTSITDPTNRFNNTTDRVAARGSGIAEFTDTITFHNNSGSVVSVQVEATLHAIISSLGYDLNYWCSPGNIGFFSNTAPGATLSVTGFQGQANHSLSLDACNTSGSGNTSFTTPTLTLSTEQPFTLDVSLRAAAGASPFFGTSPVDLSHDATFVQTSADATSTGLLFIDVLTPGASFTSESGALYQPAAVAAVPEPGTLAVLAIGLMGVMALRRSRWFALAPALAHADFIATATLTGDGESNSPGRGGGAGTYNAAAGVLTYSLSFTGLTSPCPSSGFLRQPARQNKGGSGASVG
jgi:hypothetical protein